MDLAFTLAQDSPSFGNARICALLVVKNRVVSVGYNTAKSHPLTKRYARHVEAIYPHAEQNAIYNAIRRAGVINWKKAVLYVARAKKMNKIFVPGIAKPCDGCQEAIYDFQIDRVVWTTDYGNWETT